MAKKQKKRNSRLNSSQLSDSSKNSFCSPSSNNSLCEGLLPESFVVFSVESTGCDLCMYKHVNFLFLNVVI